MAPRERASDRWLSITFSVLLHLGVVALLGYGWWAYKQRVKPVQPTLAIEATTVDARTVERPSAPEPPPPEPEPEPEPGPEPEPEPPQPTPEELAQKELEAREAQERAAEEQRRLEEERRLAEERAAAEERARQEAEARRREEERRAEQRRLAELKRKEEEKRKAEAKARAEREAELRRQLEEEERIMQARASGAMQTWRDQITARIQRAWLRPPSARPGLDCMLYVTQVPGGEVVNVRLGECNGDQAVRDSIVSAVYRASPLPPPPDPALFERNLEIRFIPQD